MATCLFGMFFVVVDNHRYKNLLGKKYDEAILRLQQKKKNAVKRKDKKDFLVQRAPLDEHIEKDNSVSENLKSKLTSTEKAVASRAVVLQKECKNAIVKVMVDQSVFNWTEPYKSSEQVSVCGSGFFINEDGFFLTNYHVIGNAIRVQIQTPVFGQEKLDCEVVGVCPERDLALLKLKDDAKKKMVDAIGGISFLRFGDSDGLRRGVDVIAIGYPLGKDIVKGVTGVISGWEEVILGDRGGVLSCCETTAPINPGSSGGPVINLDGEVIGISFAGITKAQNVGYLLPINELVSAIEKLYTHKIIHKPYIGIMIQDTNKSFGKYFGSPEDGGVYVRRVLKGSLADKAGILAGDMIYEFNGFMLDHHADTLVPWREDFVHYQNISQRLEVGDDISIVVYRDGVKKTFDFKLAHDKSIKIKGFYPGYEEIDYEVFGGMVVMSFSLNHVADLCSSNPALLKYVYPENWDKTVLVVTHIQGTSEAHKNLLGKGSMIHKVGGVVVTTLDEFRREVESCLAKDFVTVSLEDQSLAIFETASLLKDELRLSGMYKYDVSHSVALRKALDMAESMK